MIITIIKSFADMLILIHTHTHTHIYIHTHTHIYIYIYIYTWWYQYVLREFRKRFLGKRPAFFKSGQWHFQQEIAPVHNSIFVTDYLNKMGIKTVTQHPYSRDLALCEFWLFPKLRRCRYETFEEMKEAVTKVIETITQEDFHSAF